MSIGPLSNLASNYVESLIGKAFSGQSAGKSNAASASQTTDANQLSPFAELLSTLQQLQQSNPAQYQQVTQQIATNLTTAANTATADGNTTLASTLTGLATDFTTASTNDQLPNIQDLATAMQTTGHHGHHHHETAASGSTPSGSTTSTSTSTPASTSASSSTSDLLSQLIASYQSSANVNQSTDPMSVITSTMASAGIDL